ncbi:hypothetical protein [Caulobacter sp. BK020]|uniref:hypothetical protein n=1 Tax=Caulobacter sp. BK020 TaxID=2512117 RepID=UPI001048E70D|nr:hypothetical protein [Caulobacter sp. BK020]TCS11995.1 hypothetical protein EV278_116108 [Caulobacter sp. BK020]
MASHGKFASSALGVIAILAASPAPAQVSAQAAAPTGSENVFVFRAYAEPTLWSTTLKVDGRNVATLKQNSFTAVRLAAGVHKFKLGWPLLSAQSNAELQINIEPDKTYYLAVIGEAGIDHVEGNIIYVRDGSGFVPVEPEKGATSIQACCTFTTPTAVKAARD